MNQLILNEIDAGIVDLVKSLNMNGFETLYSCQGVKAKGEGTSHSIDAYIMFRDALPANFQKILLTIGKDKINYGKFESQHGLVFNVRSSCFLYNDEFNTIFAVSYGSRHHTLLNNIISW